MCMAWNTSTVNIGSAVLSAPPCNYDPLRPHLQDLRGLSVTLVAIAKIINMGLFLPSIPIVSSAKL